MPLSKPLFDPSAPPAWEAAQDQDGDQPPERDAYLFHDTRIVTAVNVAMAARRPLLVTGPPGAGKSSLARAVARELGRTYVEQVVTSRTELRDLTAGFDAVRRLADAQAERLLPDWAYIEPGVLWWAFDAGSAASRGQAEDARAGVDAPPVHDPREQAERGSADVVLLLDEIDKAEPDLTNDLLGPLDSFSFDVTGVGRIDAMQDVFVLITSNGERRLPPAFLRRCVQLELRLGRGATSDRDSVDFFVAVAEAHFGARHDALYGEIAEQMGRFRTAAVTRGRREPSTAELLDTIRACLRFGLSPASPEWQVVVETALWKDPDLPPELAGAVEPAPA